MSTEKMTDRVRKLFAKAESTTSEHEAEALLARAYDLLAKYGIEEAVARSGNDTDSSAIGSWTFTPTGRYQYDQIILVNQAANALHCSAIRLGKDSLRIYGAKRHLDRVEMLAGLLVTYMLAAAARVHPSRTDTGGLGVVAYRKSVMIGFAVGVGERLAESEKSATEETADTKGTEVVLASDQRRAAQALAEAFPAARSGRGPRRSAAGYEAGRSAASNIDLGGGNRVSGRRAIGA